MPLQGTFVVIADGPAEDIVTGLRTAGGFPIIESGWSDAPNALASAEPEAIVLAGNAGLTVSVALPAPLVGPTVPIGVDAPVGDSRIAV